MKKLLALVMAIVLCLSFTACGTEAQNEQNKPETSSTSNTEYLTKWQMAGNGVGKLLPEPQTEYSLPQSSSCITAEIENTTYEFFESYVNQCINAGFEGSIGTAESPNYYYNGKTSNGEKVQVMYYKDDAKCVISAFPAK